MNNENENEKIMSTTELTEQPHKKIIELTLFVVYCLKFLSLMQDAFVEGASEIRLKSQYFDTGLIVWKIYACNVMLWTGPQIPSPRYFPAKQMRRKEDKPKYTPRPKLER